MSSLLLKLVDTFKKERQKNGIFSRFYEKEDNLHHRQINCPNKGTDDDESKTSFKSAEAFLKTLQNSEFISIEQSCLGEIIDWVKCT